MPSRCKSGSTDPRTLSVGATKPTTTVSRGAPQAGPTWVQWKAASGKGQPGVASEPPKGRAEQAMVSLGERINKAPQAGTTLKVEQREQRYTEVKGEGGAQQWVPHPLPHRGEEAAQAAADKQVAQGHPAQPLKSGARTINDRNLGHAGNTGRAQYATGPITEQRNQPYTEVKGEGGGTQGTPRPLLHRGDEGGPVAAEACSNASWPHWPLKSGKVTKPKEGQRARQRGGLYAQVCRSWRIARGPAPPDGQGGRRGPSR